MKYSVKIAKKRVYNRNLLGSVNKLGEIEYDLETCLLSATEYPIREKIDVGSY